MSQFHNKSLAEYNDTFNMIFGTTNTDIDLFNNGFIQPNLYELDQTWKPKLSTDMKLKKCTKQELLYFITEQSTSYYKNAVCFEDKNKVVIENNWFD